MEERLMAETDQKLSARDLVLAFYEAALNDKDVDKAKRYLGDTYIQHNPRVPDGPRVCSASSGSAATGTPPPGTR